GFQNPFWANLQVYDYLLHDARQTTRWRDKLGIWFRRTGWRPADVEARYPRGRADLSAFHKFDPQIPRSLRRYVLAQFSAAAIATLAIGVLFAFYGIVAVLLPCVMLWVLLLVLGMLNEGRDGALRLEAFRLLVINPLALWAMSVVGPLPMSSVLPGAVTYSAVSLGSLMYLESVLKQPIKDIN
ncbi:MAG: hypothetical protein AAFX10_08845, partial [Pseudomonadota bacterium]